ncbi:ABC transporter substrate-binding protein [Pelagibacterium sp. 26DY04]|uniref:ABC transporter substrate-binding protein n=1 Tax=Pelagibacterium sp. 26DY04 TaxID=2967130 RepID=UPI0028164B3F|nr:ABC transporter substrate-binding protein [Pelagibacterium sp. 26DY04]WMT88225.1 ABC transporter substrate-binding protein [Pelagibacterium sp. 26DY04]
MKTGFVTIAGAALFLGLSLPVAAQEGGGAAACVEAFDPSTDYFPEKVEPRHSAFWSISYHNNYKLLTVPNSEFPDAADLAYVLVQCGTPEPDLTGELEGALVVDIPVDRTMITHNNGLAMLDEIDALGTIVGVSNGMINSAQSDHWFGRVLDAANDPQNLGSSGIDFETALGLEADILVMAGYGPGYSEVADARDRGLPAVMVSNRIEPTPLGSSEWLKFLSAFYNLEGYANEHFDAIEERYQEVADRVENQLPSDFSAAYACIGEQRGCTFMYAHGPRSLNGQILETLGVNNPFAEGNDAGNGMTFDFETSLGRAANADFFILYYEQAVNVETIATDTRYQSFPALAQGNYLTGTDENYAECGATNYVHVDRLIRDYAIGILPELFPGESGVCFTRP